MCNDDVITLPINVLRSRVISVLNIVFFDVELDLI